MEENKAKTLKTSTPKQAIKQHLIPPVSLSTALHPLTLLAKLGHVHGIRNSVVHAARIRRLATVYCCFARGRQLSTINANLQISNSSARATNAIRQLAR